MGSDKVNIGLTVAANKVAERLMESGLFKDKMTVAKFGLAYAVKNTLDTSMEEIELGEGRGASWNIGSFDGDKYLHTLMIVMYPDSDTPYRQLEILMNTGLIAIGKVIEGDGLSEISALM